MPTGFSLHDSTAFLKENESSCHGHCGCPSGQRSKRFIPDPLPLDEWIVIHDLSVDPETHQVSLISNDLKTESSGQKALEENIALVNKISQYISKIPFPHCPPVPEMTETRQTALKTLIDSMKEEANTAFKESNFEKTIEIHSQAAELASTRPLFEPLRLIKEELSIILCERSSAYSAAKMWEEALCDAEAVIEMKKKWTKGYLCKAKALKGMGRIDDAQDATLVGLEFEPDHSTLQALLTELST